MSLISKYIFKKINLCRFCTQPHHIGAISSNIAAVVCKESQETLIYHFFLFLNFHNLFKCFSIITHSSQIVLQDHGILKYVIHIARA